MIRIRYKYIVLVLSFLILNSCSVSKNSYIKGLKLEEEGMITEASNYYYDALQSDITNVDASIRLKNVSEIIMDEKFDNFKMAINEGNNKRAIHEFISVEQFRDKLKSVNVNLRIPEEQYFYYTEIKASYVNEEIDRVYKLISEKKFIEAKSIIDNVKPISPWNQELRDLDGFVMAQPVYEEAIKLYDNNKFKKAYYKFDKVINYSNARELKKLAKERATLYVGLQSFQNTSDYYDLDEKLTLKIEESLLKSEDPFLKVFESDKYKRILSEKELSNTSDWSENANLFLKTDVVVNVILNDVHISRGKLTEKKVKGWQYVKRKVTDENGKEYYKDGYKKVYYYKYDKEKVVDISLTFQLKHFENNKIITSKIFTSRQSDNVSYIEFDGDPESLRMGYWESFDTQGKNDRLDLTDDSRRYLKKQMSSRKNTVSTDALENRVINDLSTKVVDQIMVYSYDIK